MSEKKEKFISRLITAFTCVYMVWTGYWISSHGSAFKPLFSDLGAEIPAFTRIALILSRPEVLWPVITALCLLLIAMEIKGIRSRIFITEIVFMATAMAAAAFTEAFFQPMLQIIKNIG